MKVTFNEIWIVFLGTVYITITTGNPCCNHIYRNLYNYYQCDNKYWRWWKEQCFQLCDVDFTKCPTNCYILGNMCIHNCPEGSYRDFKHPGYCNTCHESCISCYGPTEMECLECTHDYYLYENQCNTTCPEDKVPYNKICSDRCPAIFYNNHCLDKCPLGYFESNFSCHKCNNECISCNSVGPTSCFDCRHAKYNGTCLRECPNIASYLNNRNCVKNCPNYSTNFTCVEKCETGFYYLNTTCVEKCPEDKQNIEDQTCVTNCSQVQLNDSCLSKCPRDYFLLDNLCVNKRPPTHPFINEAFDCLKTCEKLKLDKLCLSECPDESTMSVFNQTCVHRCPISHPIKDPVTHNCVKNCTEYKFNDGCVSQCPSETYLSIDVKECLPCNRYCEGCFGPTKYDCFNCAEYNSSQGCVSKCPKQQFAVGSAKGKYCSKECPDKMVEDSLLMECLDHCTQSWKYEYKQKCYNKCPKSLLISQVGNSNNYECVSECPDGKYIIEDECVNKCPGAHDFMYNDRCVATCPNDTFVANDQKICYDLCMDNYYTYKHQCIKLCMDNHGNYLLNEKGNTVNNYCLVKCPNDSAVSEKDRSKLIYNDELKKYYTSQKVACTDECSGNTLKALINETLMCVKTCPPDIPYIQHGECVNYPKFYNEPLISGITMCFILIQCICVKCCWNYEKKLQRLPCTRRKPDFDELYRQYLQKHRNS